MESKLNPSSPRLDLPPVDAEIRTTKKSKANRASVPTGLQMTEVQTAAERASKKRSDDVAGKMQSWGVSPEAITTFTDNKGDVRRFHALFCGKNPIVVVGNDRVVQGVDTNRASIRTKPITSGSVLVMQGRLEDACAGAVLSNDCEGILKQTRKIMKGGEPPTLTLNPSTNPVATASTRERKKNLVVGLPTSPRSPPGERSVLEAQRPRPLLEIKKSEPEGNPNAIEIFSATKKELLEQHSTPLDKMQKKIRARATNRSVDERSFVKDQSKANRAELIERAKTEFERRIKGDPTYAASKTTLVRYSGDSPLWDKIVAKEAYPSANSSLSFIVYSNLPEGSQFVVAGNRFLGGGVLEPVGPNFAQEEQAFFQCSDLLLVVAREYRSGSKRTTVRSDDEATATSAFTSSPVLIKGTTPILSMPESVARITSRTTPATRDNVFLCPPESFDPSAVLVPAKGSAVGALCVAAPNVIANDHYNAFTVKDMLAGFAMAVKLLDRGKPLESVPWGAGMFGHDPRMSAAVQILVCKFYGVALTIHGMDDAVFNEAQVVANSILEESKPGSNIMLDDFVDMLVNAAVTGKWVPGRK